MAGRLRIFRQKWKKKGERILGPKDLETDPFDENSGISSHWHDMIEEMEIEIVHTPDGVRAKWKPRGRR
jgi:hypothetical protein